MTRRVRMGRLTTCLGAMLLTVACGRNGGAPASAAPGAPAKAIDANIIPPTVVGMNVANPQDSPAPSVANLVQSHSDFMLVTDHGWEAGRGKVKTDPTGHPIDVPAGTELVLNVLPDGNTDIHSLNCTATPGWSISIQHGADLGASRTFRVPIGPGPADNPTGGVIRLKAQRAGVSLNQLDCRDSRLPPAAQFEPSLLTGIKPFRVIRFMDWMHTNNAPHQEWTDRPTPNDFMFVQRGVPVETMVALANESKVDPWFTLPWDSTPEYYRNFAIYVRDHLAPERVAYIELSNEVWNTGFKQAQDAETRGKQRYPGEEGSRAADYYYADSVRDVMTIWSDVFKGQEKRIVRVASSMAILPDRVGNILGHKDTWRSVDLLATAPYFGTDGFEVNTTDAKTRIDKLFANGPSVIDRWIFLSKEAKRAAAKYGVAYGTYEGGPGYLNGVPDMQKQLTQMARDPRMYDLYSLFLNRWQKEVGGLFMAYNSVGDFGQYGSWGHLEYPSQPLSQAPKMRALVDFIGRLPAPR